MMNDQSTTKKKPTNLKTKFIRVGLFTTVSVGLIGLTSLPSVRAFPAQVSNFIPNISAFPVQVSNFVPSVSNQVSDVLPTVNVNIPTFESFWQSVLPELTKTLGDIPGLNEVGALGLPDIFAIEKEIEKKEGHKGWDEVHESQRVVADTVAQKSFSKKGQEEAKQVQQALEQQVKDMKTFAELAESEVITQEVLKSIAWQQQRQGVITGIIREDLSDLKEKQDANNMILSNVSETLDKGQSYLEQERAARARSLQEVLGYMKLY